MKAFDNDQYLEKQSAEIKKRITQFDNKLYLEFGGKIFDDLHAARVLPGFKPSSKIDLLCKMKDQLEVIICINANSITESKMRADIGITYDMEVLRLYDKLSNLGIMINSVVITQYNDQLSAEVFAGQLKDHGIKTYLHTYTKGYPTDVDTIVSDEGYGAQEYIETTRPLVVVTAPGAGGGKLATCLTQLYHEHKRGKKAGFAKFETFPVWDLPLKHPVNIAYEASTADLKDTNMIDSFHLAEYGVTAVNYNRDMELFPVIKNILKKITTEEVYHSPTDMGVNMVGSAIIDDEAVKKAARIEIIRRYYKAVVNSRMGKEKKFVPDRIKLLIDELEITTDEREIMAIAMQQAEEKQAPVIAVKLSNNIIITGKNNGLMTAPASMILNAIKQLAHIPDDVHLLAPVILEPMIKQKKDLFGNEVLLDIEDVLLGLSIQAPTNPICEKVLRKLTDLKESDAHCTHLLTRKDETLLQALGIHFTSEYAFSNKSLYSLR